MMWLVLGLTVGAIAGWFSRGFRSSDGQRVGVDVPASIEPAPSAPPAPAARPQTSAERDKLVDACVWAYESSPSRAVRRRMRHALRDVGVTLPARAAAATPAATASRREAEATARVQEELGPLVQGCAAAL